jgi:AcrR family transcriptional regulator
MAVTKHKSESVVKRSDPLKRNRKGSAKDRRAVRTCQQLDAAFIDLLHRRSYGNIRVSDITRKARVGRATFYAHYTCKHDLLRSQFRRILVPLVVVRPKEPCLLDCTPLFAHVREARRIYNALMLGPSGPAGAKVMQDCLEERIRQVLAGKDGVPERTFSLPAPLVIRFVAVSLLALLAWWMEHDAELSPQEMQAAFRKLAVGALGAGSIETPG